jgi:hypothetical protein
MVRSIEDYQTLRNKVEENLTWVAPEDAERYVIGLGQVEILTRAISGDERAMQWVEQLWPKEDNGT